MYWIFRTAGQNDEVAGRHPAAAILLGSETKPQRWWEAQNLSVHTGGHVKFITAKASLQRNALFKVMKELRLDFRVIVLLKEKGD